MATPAPSFDIAHKVVDLAGNWVLRLLVDLQFSHPDTGELIDVPFRIDTGADVSVIPGWAWVAGLHPLQNWPPDISYRTASGAVVESRRARGLRYRFAKCADAWFRTDFSVATTVSSDYGLLAWRDLALDFDIHTAHRPRAYPDGTSLAFPGVLRFTLRPDRFPVRVG